jgi:NAD+ diphosphatase
VVRDGKILLAQSSRFPAAFYSVLAGFVEPGETFEECVRREVREEVGIEVEDLRYFGSQPWPFPHSLMVGFTASFAGGELVLEEKEIVRAGWFGPEEVRRLQIPRHGTIARRLIDRFLSEFPPAAER